MPTGRFAYVTLALAENNSRGALGLSVMLRYIVFEVGRCEQLVVPRFLEVASGPYAGATPGLLFEILLSLSPPRPRPPSHLRNSHVACGALALCRL